MRNPSLSAIVILAVCASAFLHAAESPNSARLVQVSVTYQESNPFLPWQKLQPANRSGYGVVVRDRIILTTETLLRNSTLVEITLPGSGKKLRTRKMFSDIQANLALITLIDDSQALPKSEILIADTLALDAKTTIIQTDNTSAIQECEGTVIQISVSAVSDASFRTLTYRLLTDLSVNDEGAPAFIGDKLAGMVVNSQKSARQATIIPFPVIRRFLDDTKDPPYTGFPSAGIQWTELVDPAKRKFFDLPDNEQGIQVLSVIPGTGAASLIKPNDVILEIDGAAIDSLGFYKDSDFGRILFPYLINGRHLANESVTMKIVREKKQIELNVPLTVWNDSDSLIPEDHLGEMDAYLIHGGLLIRELSGRYLRSHGGDWEARVGPRLSYYYETLRAAPEQPGDRILVLSGVLPDTINMGYQHIRNEIVDTVNGHKVRNMQEAFKFIDERNGLESIGLKSFDIDLHLDPVKSASANTRILESYRIPAIDSRELEKLHKAR